jgi:hypothetical protein
MATPFALLAGPYLNHLVRTATAPAMSPSANSLFPSTRLYDNRSSLPALFSMGSSDSTISFDLNLVLGTFETTDDLSAWTMLGIGSIIANVSVSYAGAASGQVVIDGGSGGTEAIAVADKTVRSGEELNFFGAAANSDANGTAYIALRNRQTGNWLSTGLTWTSTQSWVLTTTSTGWATNTLNFTVESLATCITDTVTLRIYLGTTGTDSYFDQISLWPSTNWFSVHGHNIPPFIHPIIEYSTDYGGGWTTHSTMTLRRDSFYSIFSSMARAQNWRLRFEGIPDTTSLIFLGELVVGQYFSLLHNPNYGGTLKWIDQQTRMTSELGEDFVSLHNQGPQRSMQLTFTFPSSTEYEQVHKQMFRGSRGGANLICIAPLEMDSSVVVLGRIRDSIEFAKNTPLERTGVLEIVETPLPNATEIANAFDAPVVGGA